jgi:hypothetical protein
MGTYFDTSRLMRYGAKEFNPNPNTVNIYVQVMMQMDTAARSSRKNTIVR